uniref:Uncharacterized protein n=1 Tax=Caenorhabditis japonica TaxID=281687 RepID=A0A8R1E2C1_CAEJA
MKMQGGQLNRRLDLQCNAARFAQKNQKKTEKKAVKANAQKKEKEPLVPKSEKKASAKAAVREGAMKVQF